MIVDMVCAITRSAWWRTYRWRAGGATSDVAVTSIKYVIVYASEALFKTFSLPMPHPGLQLV